MASSPNKSRRSSVRDQTRACEFKYGTFSYEGNSAIKKYVIVKDDVVFTNEIWDSIMVKTFKCCF